MTKTHITNIKGPAGPPPVLQMGTVTTGAPGTSASATITGSGGTYVLDLVVPRGNVGTVTTGALIEDPDDAGTFIVEGAEESTYKIVGVDADGHFPPRVQDEVEALIAGTSPAVPDASTTTKGKVELATTAETLTGTDTQRAVVPTGVKAATDATLLAAQAYVDNRPGVTSAYLGQVNGEVVQPWRWPEDQPLELWRTDNWRTGIGNNSTLEPTLVANGSNQTLDTLMNIPGGVGSRDRSFRLKYRIKDAPTNGAIGVLLAVTDFGGTIIPGTAEVVLRTYIPRGMGTNIEDQFEFSTRDWGNTDVYVRVRLQMFNDATTGQFKLDNVSLKEIAGNASPLMRYGFITSQGRFLFIPLWDVTAQCYRMVQYGFGTASDTEQMAGAGGYSDTRIFNPNPPDMYLTRTNGGLLDAVPSGSISVPAEIIGSSLRTANNHDQIFFVRKNDSSWALVGNAHGGESIQSPTTDNYKLEADLYGDGNWHLWDGTAPTTWACRLFRHTWNTEVKRPSPDNDVFVRVSHQSSYFPDGMVRTDRTTTFTQDTALQTVFEWMSSHDLTDPKIGRIGNGLFVLGEIDTFEKVATPAIPTLSTATSGGTLPAATYRYAVAALGETGETLPGPAQTLATTGSTSTVTVSWTAVAKAKGYRIYGRANRSNAPVALATVGPNVTSWVDDGSAPMGGKLPEKVNTTREVSAATVRYDATVSDVASWAVWYDPRSNWCYANIFDRDSIANRPGIANAKTRLMRGSGVMKNYVNLQFEDDGSVPEFGGMESQARVFPTGTVWTATHWNYAYVPSDPENYHLEVAARAADLNVLKQIYPSLF